MKKRTHNFICKTKSTAGSVRFSFSEIECQIDVWFLFFTGESNSTLYTVTQYMWLCQFDCVCDCNEISCTCTSIGMMLITTWTLCTTKLRESNNCTLSGTIESFKKCWNPGIEFVSSLYCASEIDYDHTFFHWHLHEILLLFCFFFSIWQLRLTDRWLEK